RGQVVAGSARPAHALDRRLHRSRVQRTRHSGAVQCRDPSDHTVAGNEDRTAVLLPSQLLGGPPLRFAGYGQPLPGSARSDRLPFASQLLPAVLAISRRELRLQREAAHRAAREQSTGAGSSAAPEAAATGRRRTGMPSTGRPGYGGHGASVPGETPTSAEWRGFHLLPPAAGAEVPDGLALIHNKLPDVAPRLGRHRQKRDTETLLPA